MVLRIVEADALFEVCLGLAQLSQEAEGLPQGNMGFYQKVGVSLVLGKRKNQLPELTRCLAFRSDHMKLPQASQHREELSLFPGLLTYLPGACVSFPYLRGRIAFSGQ